MGFKEQLDRIEAQLGELLRQRTIKDFYTTEEAAALLGKAPFTIREWCRLGRVNARKRDSGYGRCGGWMISADELDRSRNFGLLPVSKD